MTMTVPSPANGEALAKRVEPSARRELARVSDNSAFANLLDSSRFEHMQRVAGLFAASTMIPEHYRDNIGNCFIALQMAVRLDIDPFMLMQKSYVVHGKPGIEAQLAIALINSSGIFEDAIDFEINGDDPDDAFDPSYQVRAWAVRKSTGKRVNGPWINWRLVEAEGWRDKPGSKWKTMPEQMFMYRAASFFGRLHCPERLMGMQTAEELQDTGPGRPGFVEANVFAGKGEDAVRAALEAEGEPVTKVAKAPPSPKVEPPQPTPEAPAPEPANGPAASGAAPSEPNPLNPEEQAKEYVEATLPAELLATLKSAADGSPEVKARLAKAKEETGVEGIVSELSEDDAKKLAYHFKLLSLKRMAESSLLPKTGGRPRSR